MRIHRGGILFFPSISFPPLLFIRWPFIFLFPGRGEEVGVVEACSLFFFSCAFFVCLPVQGIGVWSFFSSFFSFSPLPTSPSISLFFPLQGSRQIEERAGPRSRPTPFPLLEQIIFPCEPSSPPFHRPQEVTEILQRHPVLFLFFFPSPPPLSSQAFLGFPFSPRP